jgi:four helix bundle protein
MAEKEYLLGNKAKDLLVYTTTVTGNTNLFPKRVRFTFSNDLLATAQSILRNIHAANECFFATEYTRRLDLLKIVLDDCNYMLKIIEICMELGYIDLRRCEHWSKLVLDIKYMSMSWRKKDGERASHLIHAEEVRQHEKEMAMIREIVQELLIYK